MQRNFYLSLILMTLLSFIIISGCGGDNNGATSISSISTPTPDSSVSGSNVGYITVKIIWPQGGQEGKCLISSEDNEKDITASMPDEINRVVVSFYDKTDNTGVPLTNGRHEFIWGIGKTEEKHTFGPLPAIEAIVKAEAFGEESTTVPLKIVQQTIQIKPGTKDNIVDLDLGDTIMSSKAVPVYPARDSSMISNAIAHVVAPDPNATPEPTSIPEPTSTPTEPPSETYSIKSTLSIVSKATADNPSPAPIPLKDREVSFEITEGKDIAQFEGGEINPVKITDNNGDCSVNVKISDSGTVKVKSTYQYKTAPPVEAIATIEANVNNTLTLKETPENLIIIPDFDSYYLDLVNETDIKVVFSKQIGSTQENIPGRKVNFKVINIIGDNNMQYPEFITQGKVKVSPESDLTDNDGLCKTRLICDDGLGNISGYKTIIVKAEAEPLDPNSANIPPSCSTGVTIRDCLKFKDDFERYPTGMQLKEFRGASNYPNGYYYWLFEGYSERNIIDTINVSNNNGKSAKLYAPVDINESHLFSPDIPHHIKGNAGLDAIADFGITTGEFRFYIRPGSDTLDNYCDNCQQHIPRNRSRICLPVYMTFADDGDSILDINKNNIGTYNKDQWHYVKIQIVVDTDYTKKISCWIDGKGKTPAVIPPSSTHPEMDAMSFFGVTSDGGSVWFDDVKIYNLKSLPRKTNPDFKR